MPVGTSSPNSLSSTLSIPLTTSPGIISTPADITTTYYRVIVSGSTTETVAFITTVPVLVYT